MLSASVLRVDENKRKMHQLKTISNLFWVRNIGLQITSHEYQGAHRLSDRDCKIMILSSIYK